MKTLNIGALTAAMLVMAGVWAGLAGAAEPIDQLQPIDDAALDGVQGPAGVSKKGALVPTTEGSATQAGTALDGLAAANAANAAGVGSTLGIGVVSLGNSVQGSAIDLSSSPGISSGHNVQ